MILALMYVPVPSIGFFHRFCDFKLNRISETLSLEEKSLSLGKSFDFHGGNLEIPLSLEEKS